MLALIRRFAKTWPAKLLFGVLVAAFGLWGVAGKLFNGGDSTTVATVGGTSIQAAEAQRAYQQQMAQIAKQNGADYSPPAALRAKVAQQSVQQLVLQAVLAEKMKQLGMAVPDAAVRAETFGMGAFKGPSGSFDRATFLAALARNNMDETRFIAAVRDDLARRQLVGAVEAGIGTPDVLVDQVFAYEREQRVASAVDLPFTAAGAVGDPTEAQLTRFWTNHPELYARPEYRRIKAVVLSPDTLARDMAVSEAEIKAYYTAASANYDKPERRSLQVLSVPDQAGAARLAAAWQGGADWAAMQAQAKSGGANAIDLPNATKGELPDAALGASAFAAGANAVVGPVKGDFGWYVVKVTGVTPPSLVTLTQAHDEIRGKLGVMKANDEIDARANKVEDALAGGGGLDGLPQGLGLAAVAGTLNARGNTPDGVAAPLPAFPALRDAIIAGAFKQKVGEAPHLDQLAATKDNPAGAYYAVEVDAVTPPAAQPYDQVAAKVRADWTRDAARRVQEARAARLLTATRSGTPLVSAALADGLAARTLPKIHRQAADAAPQAGVPAALVSPLFAMKQGDATMVATPEGFTVAQLQAIEVPATSSDPIGSAQLRTTLAQSVASDVTDQFVDGLQRGASITINDRLVQQIAQP